MSAQPTRTRSRLLTWLRPKPLDAWVLLTMLYWLIALAVSILWHAESTKTDAIDLLLPLLVGALAMLSCVSVVAFYRGVPRSALLLFLATVVVGGITYGFAGRWLNVRKPIGLDPRLKKLRRIEIVDDDSEFAEPQKIAKLKAKFPGVQIEIIASDDYQPDLPDKLRQHIEKIKRDFNERLELEAE